MGKTPASQSAAKKQVLGSKSSTPRNVITAHGAVRRNTRLKGSKVTSTGKSVAARGAQTSGTAPADVNDDDKADEEENNHDDDDVDESNDDIDAPLEESPSKRRRVEASEEPDNDYALDSEEATSEYEYGDDGEYDDDGEISQATLKRKREEAFSMYGPGPPTISYSYTSRSDKIRASKNLWDVEYDMTAIVANARESDKILSFEQKREANPFKCGRYIYDIDQMDWLAFKLESIEDGTIRVWSHPPPKDWDCRKSIDLLNKWYTQLYSRVTSGRRRHIDLFHEEEKQVIMEEVLKHPAEMPIREIAPSIVKVINKKFEGQLVGQIALPRPKRGATSIIGELLKNRPQYQSGVIPKADLQHIKKPPIHIPRPVPPTTIRAKKIFPAPAVFKVLSVKKDTADASTQTGKMLELTLSAPLPKYPNNTISTTVHNALLADSEAEVKELKNRLRELELVMQEPRNKLRRRTTMGAEVDALHAMNIDDEQNKEDEEGENADEDEESEDGEEDEDEDEDYVVRRGR